MIYEEFVRPALLKMMGHRTFLRPTFRVKLKERIKKKVGRLQLMRVAVELDSHGEMVAFSAGDQNTGIQSTSIKTQGIALLAADVEILEAGSMLDVHLLGASTGHCG